MIHLNRTRKEFRVEVPQNLIGKDLAPPQMYFQGTMPWRKEKEGILLLNPSSLPISTYMEMEKHPGCKYPLELLKLPSLRRTFVYKNPDTDIQSFIIGVLQKIWKRLTKDSLTAYPYGFAAMEKRMYTDEAGFGRYKRFTSLYPAAVKIIADEKGILKGLTQKIPFRGEKVYIPAVKTFIYTHDMRFGNYYGNSRLDAAYLPWVIDREGYKFQGLAQQDFSVPALIGRAPWGSGKFKAGTRGEIKMDFLDYVTMLGESIFSRGVIALPAGDEFDLSPLFDKKSVLWDFNKDHDQMDEAMAKGILGFRELTAKSQGSQAKAREHGAWLIECIEALDAERAEDFIMPYVVEPLIMWNFFDGKKKPPLGTLEYSPMTRLVREYLKDIFMEVVKSDPGIIDVENMAKILNVPLTENYVPVDREDNTSIPEIDNAADLENLLTGAWHGGLKFGKEHEGISTFIRMEREEKDHIRKATRRIIEMQSNKLKPNMLAEIQSLMARGFGVAVDYSTNREC